MAFIKYFTGLMAAAGMSLIGVSAAHAQDWRYYKPYRAYSYQNQYQDRSRYGAYNSYDRVEELREHIAHDRARLDEAIRCGNDAEAARQAADLARDQRLFQENTRAINGSRYYGYYNAPRYQH